jgi:hypothetical protein
MLALIANTIIALLAAMVRRYVHFDENHARHGRSLDCQ